MEYAEAGAVIESKGTQIKVGLRILDSRVVLKGGYKRNGKIVHQKLQAGGEIKVALANGQSSRRY